MMRNPLSALVVLLAVCSSASAAGKWGNLKGKFAYDGKAPTPKKLDTSKEPMCAAHNVVDENLVVGPDGGLANVVVFVTTKKVKTHPDYEKTAKDTLRFDNHNCRFEPHILPIRLSQTLEIHNSDQFSHNSNLQPIGDQGINPVLAPGAKVEYHFHKVQSTPVKINCNIHGWMAGHIVVRDNPYVAVTGEDGTFEIKDLPAEELEFAVWHDTGWLQAKKEWAKGKKSVFKYKIKEGDNDLGTIKVDPKLFVKK